MAEGPLPLGGRARASLELQVPRPGMVGDGQMMDDVRVVRGIPLLDASAIEAVKQWVYTPTLLNGVPVPVIMTVTVNFRIG